MIRISIEELEAFIANENEKIDCYYAREVARQLIQEKRVNKDLHAIIDSMSDESVSLLS